MGFSPSITRRDRRRRLSSGRLVVQTRFVVNFRDPGTGRRKQLFFARQKDAIAMRDAMVASVATGAALPADPAGASTVADIMQHWLQNRKSEVKAGTWASYCQAAQYVVGPLLLGTKLERHRFARYGVKRADAPMLDLLGNVRVCDLTTADIRAWNRSLADAVSPYMANVAKKFLKAALALAAEELQMRVPAMPTQLGRGRSKPRKQILTPAEVGCLIAEALQDDERGLYYAFPFLTGVRPSEQLGLLWDDVELAAGVIRIRRMQERDCSLSEVTKTAAGRRDIPICSQLRALLQKWQLNCPRNEAGDLQRVFPCLGLGKSARHGKRGSPLSYANFRSGYWRPALQALGLPYVTPHSARHAFISTLQAQGVEVGLVAKLAGHANANVTLGHYTQAVRGGEAALESLQAAYSAPSAAMPALQSPPVATLSEAAPDVWHPGRN